MKTQIDLDGLRLTFSVERDQDYILQLMKRTGRIYEEDLLRAISFMRLKPGIFVDVGAYIGTHTIYFSKVMQRKVIAFEPNPTAFSDLASNIMLNGVERLVTIQQTALGAADSKGDITFDDSSNLGGAKFSPNPEGSIKLSPLDKFVPQDENVSLIKIDTEGFEPDVLRGAAKTLARCRPIIVVECISLQNFNSVAGILEEFSYIPVEVYCRTPTYVFCHAEERDLVFRGLAPSFVSQLGEYHSRRILESRLDAIGRKLEAVASKETVSVMAPGANISDHQSLADLQIRYAMEDKFSALETSLAEYQAYVQNLEAYAQGLETRERVARELLLSVTRSRLLRTGIKLRRIAAKLTGGKVHVPTGLPSKEGFEQLTADANKAITRAKARLKSPGRPESIARGARRLLHKWKPAEQITHTFHSTEPITAGGEAVRVGIASHPARIEGLKATIESLRSQCHDICVYLNGYKSVPDFLAKDGITAILGPDIGDIGKFYFLDGYKGYYITCDDDIIYPSYYVRHLIRGIEKYNRTAVVGWHGSRILDGFSDYYSPDSRQVLAFRMLRGQDEGVHILGTGCTAFHTQTIEVKVSDFERPNMADLYFGRLGQRQNVPFVVLAHDEREAVPIEMADDVSISTASTNEIDHPLNTRSLQTDLVRSEGQWTIFSPQLNTAVRRFSVAFVGRVDNEHWTKGGILKSSGGIAEMLRQLGNRVTLIDLKSSPKFQARAIRGHDIVMVYPGDPNRPDFAQAEAVVEQAVANNQLVLVNLSFNMNAERTQYISQRLLKWNSGRTAKVYGFIFAESLVDMEVFGPASEFMMALPKSLSFEDVEDPHFDLRDGIFLGDLMKLENEALVGGDAREWINPLREAIPSDIPLYCIRQYGGRPTLNLPVTQVPFQKQGFGAWLSRRRLTVNLLRNCTFEMVPIEACAVGTPLIYRGMPQSLTEYIGMSGIQVRKPHDLVDAAVQLYFDRDLWYRLSVSGKQRAQSQRQDLLCAVLHMKLSALLSAASLR